MIKDFLLLLKSPKSKFILITFLISAIGFLKSFILLKIFSLELLGLVALAQTFITSVSLMQIGVVTGGYRLFAYKKIGVLNRVNSAVLVAFVLLSGVLLISELTVGAFINFGISKFLVLTFTAIGLISLYSNWVTCKLLGTKNIGVLNKIQLTSVIISFLVTTTAYWFGFSAVILGLILQPFTIVSMTYIIVPNLKPKYNFNAFKRFFKKIISLGFIPYLTTALTLLNSQIGRWTITFTLGTIILGKTFLVTFFLSLVSVFPSAISNLFFPNVIEEYELNKKEKLNQTLNRQFLILIGYYLIIILGTVLFAKTLVMLFLPKHVESIPLIYAILPAIVFLNLSGPSVILFNAAKKFDKILNGSLIAVVSYVIMLFFYLEFMQPRLIGFFIIESITAGFFFLYNTYYFFKLKKTIKYEQKLF